jgi:hypothetical protein
LSLLVAGCGGPPEPKTIDPPKPPATEEPSAKQTPSPTPSTATTRPGKEVGKGEVDTALAADAQAFVRDFMKTYDEAAVSGEFADVESMYADSCYGCKNYVSGLRKVYQSGARVEGGEFAQPKFKTVEASGNRAIFQVSSTISAYKIVSSSGEVIDSKPAESDSSSFVATRNSNGWQITAWN